MSATFSIRALCVLIPALLVAACSEGGVAADVPVQAPKLSDQYLIGTWCLAETSMMGKTQMQNIDYVFHEDGTLQYQTAAGNLVQNDGRWSIDGDRIALTAGPLKGPVEVRNLGPDSFTLNFSFLYKFQRGACGGT